MNRIWSAMILLGIGFGIINGNLPAVTDAVVNASREAVQLGITMLGVMAFWTGMLKIAEKSGLTDQIAGKMGWLLSALFPEVPKNSKAQKALAVNMISNILGLGWAATPAGLQAMEELNRLEAEKRKNGERAVPEGVASDGMCTFLILNVSSLQLISMNMVAYRSQYGSAKPAAILGPGLLATGVSTGAAVGFCLLMRRWKGDRRDRCH